MFFNAQKVNNKKKKKVDWFLFVVYFFLRTSRPTSAIAMIIAMPMPTMVYVLSTGVAVVGGVVVACAACMPNAVSAAEGPYDCVPANVALIVYSPVISGVQSFLNTPLWSLVTVPMLITFPLGSTACNVTGTPVAFVGSVMVFVTM